MKVKGLGLLLALFMDYFTVKKKKKQEMASLKRLPLVVVYLSHHMFLYLKLYFLIHTLTIELNVIICFNLFFMNLF
jgi:hypothetical protein